MKANKRFRASVLVGCASASLLFAEQWLTFGGDPQHDGWAREETVLNKSNVKSLKLIWIACGDADNTVHYERIKAWAETVKPQGASASFHTYTGAHTWPVWRMSLTDFAPLLFTR